MSELALFAGIGGGILAGQELGWRCVCAVENDPYCIGVLCARQNDGSLPAFPIWDDIRTFDGRAWRGIIDVVSGGFPCQDISSAGKGKGIDGEKSGLWSEMARVVGDDGEARDVAPAGWEVEPAVGRVVDGLPYRMDRLRALGNAQVPQCAAEALRRLIQAWVD